MGLFGKDYKEEDRLYRIKIREKLLDIPGLFDTPESSKVIDMGLCAPAFKVTKSTIEMDEKIEELAQSIYDIKTNVPGIKKIYQGLLVEMFAYRNDSQKACKGKDFEQTCKKWDLEKQFNKAKVNIENLKIQKEQLDPNDLNYNMKTKKFDADIKSEADTIKRLLEAQYMNDKYNSVVDKVEVEKVIESCVTCNSKDFAKQVNDLRKQRVKNDLEKNRMNDLYSQFYDMLDDSDE